MADWNESLFIAKNTTLLRAQELQINLIEKDTV